MIKSQRTVTWPRLAFLLLAALVASVLFSACSLTPSPGGTVTSTDPSKPFNGTRSAEVVLTDFAKIMDDTIKHSGTTFPTWKGKDTDGILLDSCQVGPNEGNKFSINIEGGPIKEPEAAASTMKTHWETLGYTDLGTVDWPGGSVEVSATTPNGTRVVFAPTQTGSFINVKSECTLDPSLNQ